MAMCSRIIIITFCLSLASHALGAQPRLTKSRLSELLQQPTVSAIHRDIEGILWVGTQQGLHRFDGANVTVFDSDRNNQNWIPDSEIRDIAEDHDGNLLVATSGGVLLKWNRHSETFDYIKQFGAVDETRLVRLLVSDQGSIWLLSKDGLFLYDARFENASDWTLNVDLLGAIGRPNDILEDASGNFWVGGNLGLAKILPEQKSFIFFDLESLGFPENSRLTALGKNSLGNITIGTDTGHIVVWDIEKNTSLARATLTGDAPSFISKFLQHEETLIIGTDRGLFSSDNQLSLMEDLGDEGSGLTTPNVYSLLKDGTHIWIGTINGLDILSFPPFEFFNSANSGVFNDVLAFSEDQKGHIWIGTYSGLYSYDTTTRTHSKFEMAADNPTLADHRIVTIATRKNELWLGFLRGGVQVVNTDTGQTNTSDLVSINGIAITKILTREENQDVLIATFNHGLFRVSPEVTKSYLEDKSLPDRSITTLFRSKTDMLLAVSENKVYLHDPQIDQFNEIQFDFGLGDYQPIVYAFAQTYSDDVLIGTKDHGLYFWHRRDQLEKVFKLKPIAGANDLENSTIYGIEPDLEGNLWCSTQKGIVLLEPEGHIVKRFTTADGLQGNDFNLGASFTSTEGLIYFGGVNGYNRFNPKEVTIDSSPSPMRLTRISLPEQDERNMGAVDELKLLQLTNQDHFVTFHFSVLDFIDPERNQFRYKLENFDPDWVDSGTRNTATYTSLPSGDYVFRVQGANSSGIWNREGISLKVRVLPPPWFSWWAYCLYSIALILLGWSGHRTYRSYAINRRSLQLANEMFESENRAEDDMQEQLELQDELIQSAYQHNRTTLSLVSDSISYRRVIQPDDVKRDAAVTSIKRIGALTSLEECLYYHAGGPVANLHKYTDSVLPELLKSSPVSPETIVTINEVMPMLLPAELASPLAIVIYELLENSIQHAFNPESPANYIQIKMNLAENTDSATQHIGLSVRDSGTGIPGSLKQFPPESSGIAIVRSIVDKLGGTLEFSSTSGTTVSITIPIPEGR